MIQPRQIVVQGQLVQYYESNRTEKQMPIVFLHGWRSESTLWFPSTQILKNPLIYIDLPGFGKSELPKKTFDLSDYVSVVKELLGKLDIKKAIFVGHSFGGRVATKMAVMYPNFVQALVLVDAAGIQKQTSGKILRYGIAKLVKPIFKIDKLNSIRKFIYQKMGAEDYVATPDLTPIYQKIIAEDLTSFYPQIKCPTQIIWGENDQDVPLSMAEKMKTMIKNSTLKVISGAGHFCFVDQPKEFGQTVLNFISTVIASLSAQAGSVATKQSRRDCHAVRTDSQ
jgi:pimeloyl-ACP methyl ester carboxylesterase